MIKHVFCLYSVFCSKTWVLALFYLCISLNFPLFLALYFVFFGFTEPLVRLHWHDVNTASMQPLLQLEFSFASLLQCGSLLVSLPLIDYKVGKKMTGLCRVMPVLWMMVCGPKVISLSLSFTGTASKIGRFFHLGHF